MLAAILLLATILRIGWPKLTEFKFSEARLEALALEVTQEGRLPLVGVPSSAGFDHSPISVYLYLPAFLFTTDPIPATIYGGLMGVSAVALCWWLGRRWPGGGHFAAPISALLLAVNPWLVVFSRKIWQVAFVPLLTLAFIGLVISALVEGPESRPLEGQRTQVSPRQWRLSWAIVVYALLVQVHPSAASLAPALVLWLVVFWRRVKIGPLLLGAMLGGLTAVPFLVHQIQTDWPVLSALRSLPEAAWDLLAARLTWEVITGRSIHALAGTAYPLLKTVPNLGWVFNFVGWLAVGACLGLLGRMITCWRATEIARRQATQVDLVLLSWLAVPILFNLRHSLELHLHFFALVAPAAFLLIGRAAELGFSMVQSRTFEQRRPRRWARLWPILGVIVFGALASAQVAALVMMARFVATHDTPGGFGTPLGGYLEIADRVIEAADVTGAAEVLVVGQGDSIVVDATPAIFDVLLRDRIAYRFVDGESTAVFPLHPALALLTPAPGAVAGWYAAQPTQDLGDGYRLVTLDGSSPQEGLSAVSGARTFQNGVELQGYTWELTQQSQGRFWLMWQVLWLDPGDTHFFVHLSDTSEQSWGQQDSEGYPLEHRRKGDRVVSVFDITAEENASPTPYWARIGLYRYPDLVNVPLINEAGNPIGDAVMIGPLGNTE